MYVTGVGAISPVVADGAAPLAATPKPRQSLTVTVGASPLLLHMWVSQLVGGCRAD